MYIDFTNYPLSDVYYGGSEKKLGIIINGEKYMLKFQKLTPFGKRNNHISEYIGSHIFDLLGFNTHKTILGTYKGEEVVACKDFVNPDVQFVPFNDVGESSIETNKDIYQYEYDDIIKLLEYNKKLTNVETTIHSFFEIYIVDALLGNFDRHGANWGFLKKNNKYELAPVFDNGSCLFPQIVNEDDMLLIMDNEEEMNRRVYEFPTSQIKLNGKKSSYFDVISSLKFPECNKALIKIYNKIKLNDYFALIDELKISDIHKRFYKTMLQARFEKIIKFSYLKLMESNNGKY